MAVIIKNRTYLKSYQHVFRVCHSIRKFCNQEHLDEQNPEEYAKIACKIEGSKEFKEYEVTADLSNGMEIIFRGGKLAKLADGSATVTLGNTTVMSTAVSKCKTAATGFTPLTVSFHQKAAALGRIPLNFLRRESGQNENEILTSRLIDRSLRPLFPQKFNWETQIVCNPLALDGDNFPDIVAINAASTALAISNIPWNGPVGAVRVGYLQDETIIINPTKKQLNESLLNLVIACREKNYVVMMEGCSSNILMQDFLKAIKYGVKECRIIIQAINSLQSLCGKPKREFTPLEINTETYELAKNYCSKPLLEIFQNFELDKLARDNAVVEVYNSFVNTLSDSTNASEVFNKVCKEVFRDLIFENEIRCDGRSFNSLRNINCEVDLYKPLHGSALFQRGQTQVLCTVALDSPNSALRMDRISMLTSGLKEKNFFVHYEFPPFATNEVGRTGPVGRREIGHGSLAEKALKANVPENFPFTIRLTSEVLESNGSSSMATVCGGTLALLDAGVPMSNQCAGVAIGIVTRPSDENPKEISDYRLLTDLLGIEDYYGDMDFKIAGTSKHITAVQMDVKIPGLPLEVITKSMQLAKSAISVILKEMSKVCSLPRETKKENWPVMERVTIPVHLRTKFIGVGGINLKKLEMNAGVEIIEETPGEFCLFATNRDAMNEATETIKKSLASFQEPVLEFGGVYMATVVEIKEHGCMVTLYPTMQPVLIHVSQLDQRKVAHPSALGIEVGQEIRVKYFGRDPVSGLMRLSRKVLQSTGSFHSLTKKEANTSVEEEK